MRRVSILWRWAILTLIAVVLPAIATPAAAGSESFPRLKPLEAVAGRTRPIASFDLDEALLAETDDAYANLRIFDDTSAETPFLVRTKREKKTVVSEREISVRTLSLQTLPSNRIEVVLEKEQADRPVSAIVLHTAERNYEKHVTIYGSDDRQTWTLIAERQPVFDYSKFLDLSNERVACAAASFRCYRIEIENIAESKQSPLTQLARETRDGRVVGETERSEFVRQDYRLERVEFIEKIVSEVRAETVMKGYAVLNLKVENRPREKTTVVTFAARRAPLTELTLVTATPNFSRSLTVEATDGPGAAGEPETWRHIAGTTVSRIDTGAYRQDAATVPLGRPCRFRRCRLTIANLDSPPLDIGGVEARGEVHEALFFCSSARAYRAFHGARDMPAPRYDIGAVLTRAETAETDTYRLGEERPNPAHRPAPAPAFSGGRKLLVAAVALMVITLGALIARSLRKLDTLPPQ